MTARAVLIGVSDYRRMPALLSVAANLADLRGLLVDPEVGGLAPADCVVVADPESSSDLLGPVHEAAREATDLLIVYFAGHGLLDDAGELYLALPDGARDRLPFAVRFGDLRREVVSTARKARAKVVVLDCCYSGRAMTGFMGGSGRIADQAEVEGAFLMTATAETVAALAPRDARHTAFTGALIETLRDGVPGGPALLDLDTVFDAVEQRLRARARPIPQRRSRNAGHRVTIARNRAADQPAPDPVPPRRDWWPLTLAGLAVLTAVVALIMLPRDDKKAPVGLAPSSSRPAVTVAPSSLPAAPSVAPRDIEELTVNLYGRGKTRGGLFEIRVTEVGQTIRYFVITPEQTCRVDSADVGDSMVMTRRSGQWAWITVVDLGDSIGTGADFTIPVDFRVEQGKGPAPTGDTNCRP
ncbi:caspase domain-containing protein [Actinoplanes sp. NPDC051859]|uniref:caspase domain-containing protein n=1 Tax=Actinoplanes sp. NPDC051859 TaxID=3363909 RepID=UPI0037A85110